MPRHRTLRAVVEWSWDLLSAKERLLAERLAVFRKVFIQLGERIRQFATVTQKQPV